MRILPLLSLLALPLAAGAAAAQSPGVWSLIAESGGCKVSFLNEAVDDGIFFVDRGDADCGPDVGRITGYALNDDGATIVFYSTLDAVELVGQASRTEDGIYLGKIRSGQILRLEHLSGPRGITDPATGLRMGEEVMITEADPDESAEPPPLDQPEEPGTTVGCLFYAGGTNCAEPEDIGPPAGGQLQTLSRMNMRDQGTTEGSTVVGRIEAGSCLAATLCAEDADGRLWCGVDSDGLQGFVLKQDADTVYAKNSCD